MIFLLVDGGLNVYFIVLVKRKLLQSGVTKYYPLFWFNIAMVVVSLSLDAVLIGLMSLRNGLIYAVSFCFLPCLFARVPLYEPMYTCGVSR